MGWERQTRQVLSGLGRGNLVGQLAATGINSLLGAGFSGMVQRKIPVQLSLTISRTACGTANRDAG